MGFPTEVRFRGMARSAAVEDHVRRLAVKLERHHDRITGCHVTVSAPHQHQHKGRIYGVHIDLVVPGDEIVINRGHDDNPAHEDVHVAIRDAFAAITRILEERGRKMRESRSH